MAPWSELELHGDLIDLLAAAVVFAGLTVCLFGLRLWRVVLAVVAFGAGCAAGCTLAAAQAPGRTGVMLALGVALGCVLMIALAGLPRLGTFVVLAAVGWLTGRLVAGQMQVQEPDLMVVAGLAGALTVALLPFCFDIEEPAVVLVTSIAGAWAAVWGTAFYFDIAFARVFDAGVVFASPGSFATPLAAIAVLALLGLALQTAHLLRAGPSAAALRRALTLADLPTQRRVGVLERLRGEGVITSAEYHRHVVRILAGAHADRAPVPAPSQPRRTPPAKGPRRPAAPPPRPAPAAAPILALQASPALAEAPAARRPARRTGPRISVAAALRRMRRKKGARPGQRAHRPADA